MKAAVRSLRLLSVITIVTACHSIPASGEDFTLDLVHSTIGFSIGHLGIGQVKGAFTNYTGTIKLDNSDPATLSAEATIKVDSICTRNTARDNHILGKHFFDAATFPEIHFKSEKIEKNDNGLVLTGTFTMHGTSRTLQLPLTVNGPIVDPWGNRRIGVITTAVIDRGDYGVGSDSASDKMIGSKVTLEICVEAVAENVK